MLNRDMPKCFSTPITTYISKINKGPGCDKLNQSCESTTLVRVEKGSLLTVLQLAVDIVAISSLQRMVLFIEVRNI